MSSLSLLMPALIAADRPLGDDWLTPRLVGEASIGTAGFEIGVAAEFRCHDVDIWQVRPEAFVNDDGRIGVGASIGWDLHRFMNLPDGHDLIVGPRVAFHNSDHDKWEADAMGIYSFPILPDKPFHHHIEIIGTLGVLQHRDDDGSRDARVGASIGAGYAYQF
jgi:hypothetical protein